MTNVLPLINDLHSDAMQVRHWKSLSKVCNSRVLDPNDPKLALEDLLELKLENHVDDVSEVRVMLRIILSVILRVILSPMIYTKSYTKSYTNTYAFILSVILRVILTPMHSYTSTLSF